MEKAIVFGGSGFLGSHVVDELNKAGYEVTIFDRKASKFLQPNYRMIVSDTTDREKVLAAIEGMDYVFHYSGIAGIADADEDPVLTAEANFMSTLYILDACVKHKVKRFMYASTIYVYSNNGSFYRCSKQASELFIKNYLAVFGLKYTILRYGSLYGKRANHFNFINNVIKQAFLEKKITRKGDGEEIRDYINVMDAARASVRLMKSEERQDHVMLTGNQTMRVRDLLFMIREIFSNNINVEFVEGKIEGHYQITPYSFKPDVARKYYLDYYRDLGQGVLECIYDVHEQLTAEGKTIKIDFSDV